MALLQEAVLEVIDRAQDLADLGRDELAQLRSRGLRLENILSFARREVQTRLDAVELGELRGAELTRRLAVPNQPVPPIARRYVDLSLSEEDVALATEAVTELAGPLGATEVSPAERSAWLERQRAAEQTLSDLRRRLHAALDVVSDALIERVVGAQGQREGPPFGP